MTRFGYVMTSYFAAIGIVLAPFVPCSVKLLWNASASAPVGLYGLHTAGALHDGDLVALMPPKQLAIYMVARGYIGPGIPLLKHIAALPGQAICRIGDAIFVDAEPRGIVLTHDRMGRALPVWRGCHRIARGEIFVMNTAARDSFDSRYFGAIPASGVLGTATPILTRDTPTAPLRWRGFSSASAASLPPKG